MTLPIQSKLVLRSACFGIVAAIALGAVAFAVAPLFDGVAVYSAPARLVVPIIGPAIPSRLIYWLIPDGGAPAGILLILISAVLFWSTLFGATYFAFARSKSRLHAMRTAVEKPATRHVALSTIAPFVVGLCATRVTMVVGERYGMDTLPFVLVGWCVVLGISAGWLNQVVFGRTETLLPSLAGIVAILLIWSWQKLAFTRLVPSSGLTYGYFLTPIGATARFWVLTCPLRIGLTCLSACFIAALVSGWRVGRRGLLLCVIPWWLTAFLIFALPSMYLDAQGNASVFI
jgi:hypothetical protein